MKIISLLFALLMPLALPALFCVTDCNTDWKLEVRGAYYYATSKKLREVYPNSWLDYQVEASKRVGDFFEIWTGVYWLHKKGEGRRFPDAFKDRTKIGILPICLGGKFIYPLFPCAEVYCGAGLCYSFLKIHNHCKEQYSYWGLSRSPFQKNTYKNDFGGVAKIGIQIALSEDTFLDIFADYISQRFKVSHSRYEDDDRRSLFTGHVDCSGFKFGAGLGVYF